MSFKFEIKKMENKNGLLNKKTKFCLWTHVQNESKAIIGMLECAYKYIDYWVLVDNGSTDGTQDLIINFFKEKNIPGKLFQNPNGWISHGVNRNWAWQKLGEVDHGCDWILRMDADEGLHISNDFDWSVFDLDKNTNVSGFLVRYVQANYFVRRLWIYRWGLNWRWPDHKAHELPIIDDMGVDSHPKYYVRDDLSDKFRQYTRTIGAAQYNPIKYLKDVNKLELQVIEDFNKKNDRNLNEFEYHIFYIGMSYLYHGSDIDNEEHTRCFYFGKDGAIEHNRRAIEHWTMYIKNFVGYNTFMAFQRRGEMYYRQKDYDNALKDYLKSFELTDYKRCEAAMMAVDLQLNVFGNAREALKLLKKTMKNECTLKYNDSNFVYSEVYFDTGTLYFDYWFRTALQLNDKNEIKFIIDYMKSIFGIRPYEFIDYDHRDNVLKSYIAELEKLLC